MYIKKSVQCKCSFVVLQRKYLIANDNSFSRKKVDGTEQTFKVLRIERHPSYNPSTKDSDIALLQLSEEATLNKYVGIACLPTEEPKIKLEGTCYITGLYPFIAFKKQKKDVGGSVTKE